MSMMQFTVVVLSMRADILVVLYVHDAVYCGGVVCESGHIGDILCP